MRVLRRRRALLRAAFELEVELLEPFFAAAAAAAGRGARAGADAPELLFFLLHLVFFVVVVFFPAGPGRRGRVLRSGVQEALPSTQ